MQKYLPTPRSKHPVLYQGNVAKESISERDLLYKVLFDLKRDVTDLKKLVSEIIENDGNIKPHIVDEHRRLMSGEPIKQPEEIIPEKPSYIIDVPASAKNNYEDNKIEDIVHELEDDDSLSIEKKEKELIIKALRKNNNKRKYAARDLGISERTLYRKIKQYDV